MGKVTWEFDTETERNEIALHDMASGMYNVLWKLDQALIHTIENDVSDNEIGAYLHVQRMLIAFLDDCGVDLGRVE